MTLYLSLKIIIKLTAAMLNNQTNSYLNVITVQCSSTSHVLVKTSVTHIHGLISVHTQQIYCFTTTFQDLLMCTFHDQLCPFSMSFKDGLIKWTSSIPNFHINLLLNQLPCTCEATECLQIQLNKFPGDFQDTFNKLPVDFLH